MEDYIAEEIQSFDLIFFDITRNNRRVIAGGWVFDGSNHYEVISYIDYGEDSPMVWTIANPKDVLEFSKYLETEVSWMNKED